MRPTTRHLTTLLIAAAIAAAGCGGGDNNTSNSRADQEAPNPALNSAESVPAEDTANVLRAENSINGHCKLSRNQPGSEWPLERAIATLQRVYRANPEGTFAAGSSYSDRNMKSIVRDLADRLRKCGKRAEGDRLASVLEES